MTETDESEASGAGSPRSIVVVIADALRHDTLFGATVFGATSAMPKLAARLEGWNVLEQYFSAAPWTLPACTSLLTGLDGGVHGHYSHDHVLTEPTLTNAFGTERVKAAFVNNRALAASSGLFTDFDEHELILDHDETIARAHAFLDDRAGDWRPFFLVVHSNLVHDYYLASTRARYETAFPDRNDWFEIGDRVIRWNGLTDAQAETVRRMYGACARALDEQFDALLARLDPSVAVCFISDHGEGLAPAQARVHHGGRLHDDLLRVPCAFRLPEGAPAATIAALRRAEAQPASTGDIVPTLLDIAGCKLPESVADRSLLTRVESTAPPTLRAEDRRYLCLRNRHRLNVNTHGKNMSALARWRNTALRSTLANDFRIRCEINYPFKLTATDFVARNATVLRLGGRLLRTMHNGDPVVVTRGRTWRALELVDVAADPAERRNLLRAPGSYPPEIEAWVESWKDVERP